MELCDLTAAALRRKVAAGEVSCVEVARAYIERIERIDPRVRAFITATPEDALDSAARLDEARARGEDLPPLAGVPLALKDNMCTRGIRTTAGSRILGDWRPPYDATVTRLLREAGTLMVGKANLDEFAMGSSTENSGFFPTANPWALDRVPGGSSGGSAAAVAARMAPLGIGSDTGGSIRQPAALCGTVGLKPTYGLVSRYGLIAFASSLDQIGPLTRTVEDSALLLNAIAKHDPHDSTSVPGDRPDYTRALTGDIRGLRIGVPREYFAQGVRPEVTAAVRTALDRFAELGARVEETSTPHAEYGLACYYIIAPAEASSNLARYDGMRYGIRSGAGEGMIDMFRITRDEGFGAEVKRRIMLGTYALSAGYYDAYYGRALQVRTLVKQDFDRAWQQFDLLVTPTAPEVAFRMGEKLQDPLAMKLSDVCTIPVNMAGNCAVSIPCGSHEGLPIGLQIIAREFDESTMLRAAHAYEQAAGGAASWPEL